MAGEATDVKTEPPRWYRWMVLVLISLAMFGNYYIYDSISPLADVLKEQLGFSDSNIGLLNAIYSIPNVFMVLIGGMIIDRIGVKISTALFAVLCLERDAGSHGGGAADLRPWRRVADRCGDNGDRNVVPGERAQLCIRDQSDDRTAGLLCGAEL